MKSLVLALAFSCLLLAVRPSWTMQEAPSSSPLHSSAANLEIDSEVDPEGLVGLELSGSPSKRAYTYVSEYKRLPIYNFGLGKRWGSGTVDEDKRARLYSFGLGKRARPYSFGLGKRAGDSSSYIVRGDDYEEMSQEPVEDYLEKRSRLYSFGLGKRLSGDERGDFGQRFNFGLGKRADEDFGHRYKFGLGKRRLMVDEDEQQQAVAS